MMVEHFFQNRKKLELKKKHADKRSVFKKLPLDYLTFFYMLVI